MPIVDVTLSCDDTVCSPSSSSPHVNSVANEPVTVENKRSQLSRNFTLFAFWEPHVTLNAYARTQTTLRLSFYNYLLA